MSVYDPIAKHYKQTTRDLQEPFFLHIEQPTYFHILGDIAGKSILDLGCGEGFYSRKFKQQGAGKVVAVDISEGMLALAKEAETQEPLGIEYILCDMRELGQVGSFDLVTAAYSLNHAQTKEELLEMCQTISANLKQGGRFVAVNNNLDRAPESYRFLEEYGYKESVSGLLEEGQPLPTLAYNVDGKTVIIYDHYLSRATYEWAFREVGFKEIRWHEQILSESGLKEFGQDFWEHWLKYPKTVGIECFK